MSNMTGAFADYLLAKSLKINKAILEKAEQCRDDYVAVATAGAAKNRLK